MDDLNVLEPAGSSVTYRGEQLELSPLKIGQLPKLVRTARPVIDAVLSLDEIPDEASDDVVGLVMDLIEKHDDKVFAAAAICTGKDAEWLAEGDIDEFVVLAQAVFRVNRDFFVRRLAPLLGLQAGSLAWPGRGPTPSSSSSSTTTASPTSADTPSGNSAPSATPPPGPSTDNS